MSVAAGDRRLVDGAALLARGIDVPGEKGRHGEDENPSGDADRKKEGGERAAFLDDDAADARRRRRCSDRVPGLVPDEGAGDKLTDG